MKSKNHLLCQLRNAKKHPDGFGQGNIRRSMLPSKISIYTTTRRYIVYYIGKTSYPGIRFNNRPYDESFIDAGVARKMAWMAAVSEQLGNIAKSGEMIRSCQNVFVR